MQGDHVPPQKPILDYAGSAQSDADSANLRPKQSEAFMSIVALIYATFAIPLSLLFFVAGVECLMSVWSKLNPHMYRRADRIDDEYAAAKWLFCFALLFFSGMFYGRAAYRDLDSQPA